MASNITSQLFNIGSSAATGNYVSAGLGVLGLGMSIFGGDKQAEAEKEAAEISARNAALEGKINEQRERAMLLSARRQQVEAVRNAQRARAYGAQAAVTQGAQYGSGYSGGQAQETAKGAYNLLGIGQNLEIGTAIFGLNRQVSANNMRISQLKSEAAEGASWSAFGKDITGSADAGGRLFGQFYSSNNSNPWNSIPMAGRDF